MTFVVLAGAGLSVSASPAAAQFLSLKPSISSLDVPAGWVGPGVVPVTVKAQGALLGVRAIELLAPASSPPRLRTHPCVLGLLLCPGSWTQTFTIAADELAEGASDVRAVAIDPLGGRSNAVVKTVRVDRSAPLLTVAGDLRGAAGGWLADRSYSVTIAARDGSTAQPRSGVRSVELFVDGARRGYAEQSCAAGSCALDRSLSVDGAALAEGLHGVRVVALDQVGNRSEVSWSVGVDRRAPVVELSGALLQRDGGWLTAPAALHVAAREPSEAPAGSGVASIEIVVDGQRAKLEQHACSAGGCALTLDWTLDPATLAAGQHLVQVLVLDGAGRLTQRHLSVGVDGEPPVLALSGALADADGQTIDRAGSLHAEARDAVSGVVRMEVLLDGTRKKLDEQPCQAGGCAMNLDWTLDADGLEDGAHTLAVLADDATGRRTRKEITFDWRPNGAPDAPALDLTEITPFADQTKFLYTGSHAVQTGVAAGTIQQRRAAVIRGTLHDRTGAPVGGAKVTVLGHPEFGASTSREDGEFYVAVNGGGLLSVRIEHDDFLPVDRQVDVPWQDYAFIEDAVLVRLDPNVTDIAADGPLPELEVHRASVEADAIGERRATLLFPKGLEAEMEMPDGSRRPLTDMHVRATEYTVGETGPAAMPSPLPATSAYTYAADFAVDEARAAGAKHVHFTKPVVGYIENYRGAPVGARVPNGYYERSTQQWIADIDGRVVKVLSETGGVAALDATGGGQPASAALLATLGIDEDELREVAVLYAPGQELWRVPTKHFSDWNFSFRVVGSALPAAAAWFKEIVTDPCHESGSVIECENQTLGEDIALTGTGAGLHYRSDRVPGRTADRNTIDIPLTRSTLPAGLIGVAVRVDVGGRRFEWAAKREWAVPNKSFSFEWDGKDAFGRTLQGAQQARVSVGYVYALGYRSDPGAADAPGRSFGVPPANTAFEFAGLRPPPCDPSTPNCGSDPFSLEMTPRITVWQRSDTTIGGWDARAAGLGGWTLTPHHQYDSVNRTLYRGDGSRQTVQSVDRVINRFAGSGFAGSEAPLGAQAVNQQLWGPQSMDVGPDGSVYIADLYNDVVRRVKPDGTMVIVAGRQRPQFSQPRGFGGDGGPATQADLYIPSDVDVGPDGSLFITDRGNNRIRKVDPSGTITTVAGGTDPNASDIGDGGPALRARLRTPVATAVAPDGTLFIAEGGDGTHTHHRIRRVGPDGIISTFAGGGSSTTDSNIRATSFYFMGYYYRVQDIALAPDGSLYVATNTHLHRVTPDGFIRTVAGNGNYNYEFGRNEARVAPPALDATITARAVTVARDGTVYFVDGGNNRVWRLDGDGKIRVVAGDGATQHDASKDRSGGPALEAQFGVPQGITSGPDGAIYVSDWSQNTVRKISDPMPGFTGSDFAIPSQDGGELYRFDKTGRHLQTRDTATGLVTQTFGYDPHGRLSKIEDAHANTIGIERDASGEPAAIVAPFGQRTALDVDADGFLSAVRDPAGRATSMDYVRDGLLTRFTRPGGVASQMAYDADGRLTRDENADGGVKTLSRSDTDDAYEVSLSTRMGRTRTNRVEKTDGGAIARTATGFDGVSTQSRTGGDGSTTTTRADGLTATSRLEREPRFGMQAPYLGSIQATRPSGARSTVTSSRTVDLADSGDILSVRSITDTSTVGSRTTKARWDRTARTLTTTVPSGLSATSTFDDLGQVVREQAPGITPVTFGYDAHGRPTQTTQGERSSAVQYDAGGWLSSSTDPLGRTTRYQRDALGRATRTTLPDGRVVSYEYDAAGNVTHLTAPGRPANVFGFSLTGSRLRWTAPQAADAADTTEYRYDADGDVSSIVRPDGSTIDMSRDGAGRVTNVAHPSGATTLRYGGTAGQLDRVTHSGGQTITWAHDGDLPVSETASGTVAGETRRAFDGDGRLTSSTVTGTDAVTFAYDAGGLVSRGGALDITRAASTGFMAATALGSSTSSHTYDGFGDPATLGYKQGATDVFTEGYVRDRGARITERTESIGGQTHRIGYEYDQAGHLVKVSRDGVMQVAYGYDANGNRTSDDQAGQPAVAAQFDAQDRLTHRGGTSYRYTSNGELREQTDDSSGASTTYTYDASGSLRTVDLPGGRHLRYLIDGMGRRVGREVDGQLEYGLLYGDGVRPSAELTPGGAVRSRFVYVTRSTVPDYMVRGGKTYRFVTDHQGSPRLIVDTASGEVAQRIDYDAFGRVLADSNPGFQPFGFAGGLYDTDTGLVRFGARDYDPQTGRWTTKDPIDFAAGDTNLYGYVFSDPVNYVDPSGLFVDAFVDVAMLSYDVTKLIAGCGSWTDVGLDALSLALPGVVGLSLAAKAARRGHQAATAAKVGTPVADDAFEHGYKYHPRVRERGVEDPRAHNFPYSFDDVILKETPITQADGSLLYRKTGSINGKDGVYEIAVNPETGTIFHRTWRSR